MRTSQNQRVYVMGAFVRIYGFQIHLMPDHMKLIRHAVTTVHIARDARDILGAAGISAEYVPVRHMLNLESVITYEGTETVHQLVIGKELTGVNAFG